MHRRPPIICSAACRFYESRSAIECLEEPRSRVPASVRGKIADRLESANRHLRTGDNLSSKFACRALIRAHAVEQFCGRRMAHSSGPRLPHNRGHCSPLRGHPSLRRSRSSPSCATEATSVPSRAKMRPREKPREPARLGLSWAYKSQSSARNGRCSHSA